MRYERCDYVKHVKYYCTLHFPCVNRNIVFIVPQICLSENLHVDATTEFQLAQAIHLNYQVAHWDRKVEQQRNSIGSCTDFLSENQNIAVTRKFSARHL